MAYVAIPTRDDGVDTAAAADINQLQDNLDIIFDANGKTFNLPFPATAVPSANANTLDDYEEGAITDFGIAFGGSSTGVTYSVRSGKYIKIGNLVFVTGYIILTSKGAQVGNATITGMPFVCGDQISGSTGYVLNITFANQILLSLGSTYSAIDIYEVTEAGALTTLTNSDFTDTSRISFTIIYTV